MGQKILLALFFFILCIWNTIFSQCNRIISNCCWGWEPDRVSELSWHLEEQIAPSRSFSHYRGSNYTDRQCGSEISIWWNNISLVVICQNSQSSCCPHCGLPAFHILGQTQSCQPSHCPWSAPSRQWCSLSSTWIQCSTRWSGGGCSGGSPSSLGRSTDHTQPGHNRGDLGVKNVPTICWP